MTAREKHIAFYRNYCSHYTRGEGANMVCLAGHDLTKVKRVPAGNKGIKWGPCIEGHTLSKPTEHCPDWSRRTQEEGEKYADEVEADNKRIEVISLVVTKWRTWTEKNRVAKQEVIECPVCKGRLHLSQSACNGHVWGRCETKDCVSWME